MSAIGADARLDGRLARLLRQHRRARGLSQEELAGLTEPPLSVATLGNLERSRTRPHRHTLEVLATALGLPDDQRAELIAVWRAEGGATEPAARAPEAAPKQPAAPGRHPLPAALNSFVGRRQELDRLGALLAPGEAGAGAARLVTLVGPPGTGKTRLALQAAHRLAGAFDGRATFVSLAAVAEPALVAPAIAEALGLADTAGGSPLASLKEHFRAPASLLVLDNLEQVIAAGVLVVDLLRACPGLRVLATSREPLRVTGEQVFPVPPLSLPEAGSCGRLEDLLRSEAVALFEERARAARPSFALDDAGAPVVAKLCERLDGLPLAIELAAGRAATLPPAVLLARWEKGASSEGLALLSDGPWDQPARQRTLRAAVEWSHDLLSSQEQAVFRRLGVFEGEFTFEAAEAVCEISATAAVDMLTSLAAKCLLQQVEGGSEPRFRMLETLRAYALERLAAAGEEEQALGVHVAWLVALTERGERALFTPERDAWVERVARESDDLRAGLRRLTERDDAQAAESAERLLTSIAQLSALALVPECRVWAERLAARREPPTPVRARFLANAYLFALYQGDLESTGRWVCEAVETARAAGAARPLADALFAQGHLHQLLGRHAEAAPLLQESTGLYEAGTEEDEGRLGMSILALGISRAGEDPRAAATLLDRGLELYRRRGTWFGVTLAHNAAGLAAAAQGDPAGACVQHMAALRLCRDHGDRWTAAYILSSMMRALAELGSLETALPLMEELLTVAGNLELPYYARDALAVLERLLPSAPPNSPAAALYARYARLVTPTADGGS